MPPVPKKKHSHGRTGRRKGKFALSLPTLTTCRSCGEKKYPHKACPHCGAK